MAQQQHSAPLQPKHAQKKRKQHPSNPKSEPSKRAKVDHRVKQRDSRALATQVSSEAFKNGELDVDKFVKAREYEIRALEDGMSRSKKALNQRAFQQVPKELRRRTASHNAKRVPKRLQKRAKREMIEDNTPTVTARRRKPTRHMRLRLETAKRLRALGAKQKDTEHDSEKIGGAANSGTSANAIRSRDPKVKDIPLAPATIVRSKFRKRQINKTWLPTHLFHAKRARMTPPGDPLWRFALPLTPSAKSYRPTHRAATQKGAVAWDTSYMATICLAGQQRSIQTVLKALGVSHFAESKSSRSQSAKWMNGSRVWEGLIHEREDPRSVIAPARIVWCAIASNGIAEADAEKIRRSCFIWIHPSAFLQLWEELVRLSKIVQPHITLEDLRFEIGSIDITGPGAMEALQGALWPSGVAGMEAQTLDAAAEMWESLRCLPDQSMLPSNSVLSFDIQDPRLHFPPHKAKIDGPKLAQDPLLGLLATWPLDLRQSPSNLFNGNARRLASTRLPSQKAMNRRKRLAEPGEYPAAVASDPRIPILLLHTTFGNKRPPTWTVLLPWKCVPPVWYSIMYCPLSTGGQPRFGGLDEKRQIAFETSEPWFPGDFPGTMAGWAWEQEQRKKREDAWKRRPKSKRVNWEAVEPGDGQKGELGVGWACDWEILSTDFCKATTPITDEHAVESASLHAAAQANTKGVSSRERSPPAMTHVGTQEAYDILKGASIGQPLPRNALVTIRIKLLHRGVPQTCARIYRLPPDEISGRLRRRWLDFHPRVTADRKRHGPTSNLPQVSSEVPAHIVRQRLAASLLEPPRAGDAKYPSCPGQEHLIGFVTTGDYNLGEGQGTGMGSILLEKVRDEVVKDAVVGRLCVVRNAGESVGRLASWEIV